ERCPRRRHSSPSLSFSGELPLRRQRLPQTHDVLPGRDVDAAEAFQVGGGRLRVEQFELALVEAVDQVDEGYFAGIALAMEHALAEERGAQADAVQPAGQLAVAPRLDAVGVAQVVETAVGA